MSPLLTIHMHEWERLSPGVGPGTALVGLRLTSAAERTLAARLAAARMLSIRELASGLEIEATSYVGRIQLGDLVISIVPKLPGDALLRLFRYAYGLRDLTLIGAAQFEDHGSLFQDLLLSQLHAEAKELLSRGLQRRYVPVAEELASPRGRIDMNRLATRRASGQSTLPCRHHLRLEDCPVNRVLLAGLRFGASLATDRSLVASLHQLAESIAPRVSITPLTGRALDHTRQSLDRQSAAYAPALALIALLFEGANPALEDEEQDIRLPGFLFDMNRFFQRLSSRFLRENLPDCELREEQVLKDMMRYAPGENPRGQRPPRPRPDFVVLSKGGQRSLLDAKYRDLWRHALPREMLYQLAVYALSQPSGGRATILYPTTAREALSSRIEIREPVEGWSRASVVLTPVVLEELDALVAAGEERSAVLARRALAHRLVFGTKALTRGETLLDIARKI